MVRAGAVCSMVRFAAVLMVVCMAHRGLSQQPRAAPVTEPEAAMVWPQPQHQVLGTTSGYLATSAEFAFIAANPAAAASDTLRQATWHATGPSYSNMARSP